MLQDPLSVASFLQHHRDTVAPIFVACMSHAELELAIAQVAKDHSEKIASEIFDLTMRFLKRGDGVPDDAIAFARHCSR